MANRFNEQFQTALDSKLALQDSRIGVNNANAGQLIEQTRAIAPTARSAINLNDANAQSLYATTGNKFAVPGTFPAAAPGVPDGSELAYNGVLGFAGGAIEAGNAVSKLGGKPGGYSLNSDLSVRDNNDKGYADGGVVGSPVDADYELYRAAAKNAGLPELDMQAAIPAMAQMRAAKRAKVLKQIASGATTKGYAQGGEVDVGGALVQGEGTGKSDSIPAVIDGERPAALSNGEFIVPKNIVDYFGTKFFDALVEKARMVGKKQKKKTALAAGGVVPGQAPSMADVRQTRDTARQAYAGGETLFAVDLASSVRGKPLQYQPPTNTPQQIRQAIATEKVRAGVIRGDIN